MVVLEEAVVVAVVTLVVTLVEAVVTLVEAVVTLVEAVVGMKQIMTQSASGGYHLCALLLPMSLVGHYDTRGIIPL